jgi:hypothetical protein
MTSLPRAGNYIGEKAFRIVNRGLELSRSYREGTGREDQIDSFVLRRINFFLFILVYFDPTIANYEGVI